MNMKEKIKLVYIDDDRDEAISAYLEEGYRNEKYDVEYQEIKFEGEKGYESLLESAEVASANVILIDSKLFEEDRIKCKGKFSGEEFRIVLRKAFPFIEVLVISQNGENKDFEIIPKYRRGNAETSMQYYKRVLKDKIDESIRKVMIFRNIAKKLENNKGIEKYLVEQTVDSLNGIKKYDGLSKNDIDKLIENFQSIKYCAVLENVKEKKQGLEKRIKRECPQTKIMYNKVT